MSRPPTKKIVRALLLQVVLGGCLAASPTEPASAPMRGDVGRAPEKQYGSAAALAFAEHYRGERYVPKVQYCYPDAKGIPFADTENVVEMSDTLWTPAQLAADFQKRMAGVPEQDRKQGIIVLLKTERCATKAFRGCTVTTAALEKRSTPLVGHFLIYGLQLKPRDGDSPAGSLKIETGADAWKNQAAGEYGFKQGPGATLVFLEPGSGSKIATTDAALLRLDQGDFVKNEGRTPELHAKLEEVLAKIRSATAVRREETSSK